MSAYESVKNTLISVLNLTDDEHIQEMIIFCVDNLYGIKQEQDRDTRHKCADSVMECPEDMSNTDLKNTVHRKCMNSKAL